MKNEINKSLTSIIVVGAREHNLKNVSVSIPKNSLTVITGPSGSGKSSLAFDVLYAEGQRRYLESLSLYARQFLGMPPKAQCDRIEGLCPAIAIDQKTVGSNPRSTVGTITEVYDYLRVLFARIGTVHCPECKLPVATCTTEQILELVCTRFVSLCVGVRAPIAYRRKGTFVSELTACVEQGVRKFVIDGHKVTLQSADDVVRLALSKTVPHTIDAIVDQLDVLPAEVDERARLSEAIDRACRLSKGFCTIAVGDQEHMFSTQRMCVQCWTAFPELEPRFFSFNSPIGACARCHGLGMLFESADWFAFAPTCYQCRGKRLNERALSVVINNKNIYEVGQLSIKQCLAFFKTLELTSFEREVAQVLIDEIVHRLHFLNDVGLGYLTINRTAGSLSGGEGQRIRLARQLGSALSGVLYILDEPSIGLHQRDNDRLIETLKRLRDQGNTVLVVEHDSDTMKNADYLIDMGPAAGVHGGHIVAVGTPEEVARTSGSITGQYLSGARVISRSTALRKPTGFITLSGAKANNLQDLTVKFPLGVLCGVSGVSGSGKSSLIMDELVPALQGALGMRPAGIAVAEVTGSEQLASLVMIDQSPIGRTSRSNPATYIGIFDDIRNIFASLPESNARGYTPGRFSFNVPNGGRCEACKGDGVLTVSMHFLADVSMQCKECKGLRFNEQTLQIKFKNKTISDILNLTFGEALEFFSTFTAVKKRIQLMCDVGLDYLALGQPATTLSGGEAQRIKLVNELAKRGSKTLYVLDEPTTGLHACDIEKLLVVFDRLIDKGNSVLVIEHNLDVLKTADYIIDMGPEGGDEGGRVVAYGEPGALVRCPESYTGHYLGRILGEKI
ncbi:TPA: excinuclease ABC subunit A [Candidatus Dependentiae bacterium]|nr:excinuclease ABC subunit A [Candidatus Dependentiae bacterium]